MKQRFSDAATECGFGRSGPKTQTAGGRAESEIHALAEGMTGGRLAPDSEEPEGSYPRLRPRLRIGFIRPCPSVRMVDDCLTGFADRAEIGSFEGVVADEFAAPPSRR